MRPTMRTLGRAAVLAAVAGCPAGPVRAQQPTTRAERTDYLETSRYDDVLAFLDALRDAPELHRTRFGYTFRGRRLPLMVVGRGLTSGDPEAVRAADRVRVLVMANIHAGEVEGKEATQMLLRAFADGDHDAWLDSLVVLVAPIYNADGNEAISVLNRYRQNGPLSGVGERTNAQGLDLNRDYMKLESPEARSLVGLMTAYDPHVVVDLHTTNGSYHGYRLTYAPPLNPDTDPAITGLLRDRWLPTVTAGLERDFGWDTYYYGIARERDGVRGWYTFDGRPRYGNNYEGLRNRFGILSEAYAYASFRDRVLTTLGFVEEVLDFAYRNAGAIDAATRAADATPVTGRTLGLRSTLARGPDVDILMGAVEERLNPFSGRRYRVRLDSTRTERMTEFGTFRSTVTERVPEAYYVPPELTSVIDLLALHGVRTRRLPTDRSVRLEAFVVDSTRAAPREYQGHREREAFGRWAAVDASLSAGTVVVPTGQPLGRLVFYLLEPRSDDGIVTWNLLDDALEATPGRYPILRRPAGGTGS